MKFQHVDAENAIFPCNDGDSNSVIFAISFVLHIADIYFQRILKNPMLQVVI